MECVQAAVGGVPRAELPEDHDRRPGVITLGAPAGVRGHAADRGGGEPRAGRDPRAIAVDPGRERDPDHVRGRHRHAVRAAARPHARRADPRRPAAWRGDRDRAAHADALSDRPIQYRGRRSRDALRHRAIPGQADHLPRPRRRPRRRAGERHPRDRSDRRSGAARVDGPHLRRHRERHQAGNRRGRRRPRGGRLQAVPRDLRAGGAFGGRRRERRREGRAARTRYRDCRAGNGRPRANRRWRRPAGRAAQHHAAERRKHGRDLRQRRERDEDAGKDAAARRAPEVRVRPGGAGARCGDLGARCDAHRRVPRRDRPAPLPATPAYHGDQRHRHSADAHDHRAADAGGSARPST